MGPGQGESRNRGSAQVGQPATWSGVNRAGRARRQHTCWRSRGCHKPPTLNAPPGFHPAQHGTACTAGRQVPGWQAGLTRADVVQHAGVAVGVAGVVDVPRAVALQACSGEQTSTSVSVSVGVSTAFHCYQSIQWTCRKKVSKHRPLACATGRLPGPRNYPREGIEGFGFSREKPQARPLPLPHSLPPPVATAARSAVPGRALLLYCAHSPPWWHQ